MKKILAAFKFVFSSIGKADDMMANKILSNMYYDNF